MKKNVRSRAGVVECVPTAMSSRSPEWVPTAMPNRRVGENCHSGHDCLELTCHSSFFLLMQNYRVRFGKRLIVGNGGLHVPTVVVVVVGNGGLDVPTVVVVVVVGVGERT